MPLGIGIGIIFNNISTPSLSPQALSWQSRIVAAGGTIDNAVLTIIDDNLIKPMVSSGIFDCLDKMHLFAGTGNRIAAKINLINSSYTAIENNVANLAWSNDGGFYSTTNASTGGYLSFGYNPATAPKWSADRFNCSQFIYYGFADSITGFVMGSGSGASTAHTGMKRVASGGFAVQMFLNQTATTAVTSGMTGGTKNWLCGTRSANTVRAILNTSSNSYTLAPSATILSQEIGELCILGNTTNVNIDRNNGHYLSGHGNNNFDNQLLRTYVLNTFTALGL